MNSLRFDEDCEDDITEPIASCTSVSPQVRYILKANPFQHLLLVKKSLFSQLRLMGNSPNTWML